MRLRQAGILYVPNYIVNAGGIIRVASDYLEEGWEGEVMARIGQIPATLKAVLSTRPRPRCRPMPLRIGWHRKDC